LQQSAQQLGVDPKRISDAAQNLLLGFGFPGNVRQLENICHWLTVMAPAQVIEPKDLPPEVLMPVAHSPDSGSAQETGSVLTSFGPSTAEADAKAVAYSSTSAAVPPVALNVPGADWELGLEAEAMALLVSGCPDVWDVLCRRFEAKLILTALANTRGRRIEAAQKLGIGRNTITRKIQELNLE
jgi:two-component system nitrogen regulation response regulator GlnG